jgi:CDP-glycerol glycerophosphotransferase (TagB/SpsB family)
MSASTIKKILKASLKKVVVRRFNFVFKQILRLKIRRIRNAQDILVNALKDKKVINVLFLVIHDSIWKYEVLYRLLDRSKHFNVQIAVIPLVRDGVGQMDTYNQTLEYFKKGNYNTFGTYDAISNTWLDVKSVCNPDIVFFTNPHKLTFDGYYIDNFRDVLTCYVPYSFQVSNLYSAQFDQPFHSKLWRQFYETNIHKELAEKFNVSKGDNVIITGYPGIDMFLKSTPLFKNERSLNDPWPVRKNHKVKRVIWAPHHTIKGAGADLDYSSFLELSTYMLQLALIKSMEIQIGFKPHPLLKEKLINHKDWGKLKTENYYTQWEVMDNTIIHNTNYDGLFAHSDAMIHDSGSFAAEYLLLNNPVMFTVNDNKVLENFNPFGKLCLQNHYLGYREEDIEKFVNLTVLKEEDLMMVNREKFVREYCLPPNNNSASENIFNKLKKTLTKCVD